MMRRKPKSHDFGYISSCDSICSWLGLLIAGRRYKWRFHVIVSVCDKTLSLAISVAFTLSTVSQASSESSIGVLTLHGVGSQRQGSDFDAKLRKTLHEKAGEDIRIVVKSVYYHGESRNLQASVNKDFQWINFYDRDDLLGWPLRPLGGRFKEIVQDEERNEIGSTLTSHLKYWRHDKLNEEIARRILELSRANARPSKNE